MYPCCTIHIDKTSIAIIVEQHNYQKWEQTNVEW